MAVTAEVLETILEKKLSPLHDEISSLKVQLNEVKSFLEEANTKYEEVISKYEQFEIDKKNLLTENATLKKSIHEMDQQIKQLQIESNDVRQYTRRDCLELQGIPYNKDEDTDAIVKNVGDLMEVYLGDNDISISHRLPTGKGYKGTRNAPPLIVKFTRRSTKEKFYKARTKLKDCTTQDIQYSDTNKIFINECLTEQNKKLFHDCLKFKKERKRSSIWTSNGKVYLRRDITSKALRINSKDDLTKL